MSDSGLVVETAYFDKTMRIQAGLQVERQKTQELIQRLESELTAARSKLAHVDGMLRATTDLINMTKQHVKGRARLAPPPTEAPAPATTGP